jgi:hypothetical protein
VRTIYLTGVIATALLLDASSARAAEMAISLTLPKLEVAEYHRPYVAVWIERADQSVVANMAVWYATGDKEGARWLSDLRQWWRRTGREQTLPLDGVTGATRPAGVHRFQFSGAKAPLSALLPGEYVLAVEAVREVGGREVLRVPFTWPARAQWRADAAGKSELGAVSLTLLP